jgi:zinc D-Ala-D-Ala carboxypeptidase
MNIEQLSPHFTLRELTRTDSTLANTASSPVVIRNLIAVCTHILEPVRKKFRKPVIIHSGYRCQALNTAVGGSKRSQHCFGEAVDFHVAEYTVYEVATWVAENLSFDQLILENFVPRVDSSGWVHCSYNTRLRRQALTKFKGSSKYYPSINLEVPAETRWAGELPGAGGRDTRLA